MQTFLPYPDFKRTAHCLDSKRLGKQRVEAWQILSVLLKLRYDAEVDYLVPAPAKPGWVDHPAVLQWKGYEWLLLQYLEVMMAEWGRRKYANRVMTKIVAAIYTHPEVLHTLIDTQDKRPPWLGDLAYHKSHKSNLLRKAPAYYLKFKWNVDNSLPYIWPVQKEK